jgi:hypothetical protein
LGFGNQVLMSSHRKLSPFTSCHHLRAALRTVWSVPARASEACIAAKFIDQWQKWVKLGKAQSEQILSALPPIADIRIARSPTAEDLEVAIVKAALAQGWSERRAAGR